MSKKYVSNFNLAGTGQVWVEDAEAKSNINKLDTLIKNDNRVYLFVGDSYNEGWTPDGSVQGWGLTVASMLGKTIGTDSYNAYRGGTGFDRADSSVQSVYSLMTATTGSLTVAQRNSITDIVFGFGYNDYLGTQNEILSGMSSVNSHIISNYPNARVWLFALGWSEHNKTRDRLYNIVYSKGYYNGCVQFGWKYKTIFGVMHNKALFSSDGIHPNSAGEETIARAIASGLTDSDVPSGDATTPLTIGSTEIGYSEKCGDMITAWIIDDITVDVDFSISNVHFESAGIQFNSRHLFGSDISEYSAITFQIPVILKHAPQSYFSAMMSCRLNRQSDGTTVLEVMANSVALDGTGYMPEAVTQILFRPCSFCLPISMA